MMPTQKAFFEFDGFRINVARRILLRNGSIVPMEAKSFDVLLVLVERSPDVVRYADLIASVWPTTSGTEEENLENLTAQIWRVRKVLGETPDEHRFILNVHRVGYRFVAPVHAVEPDDLDEALPSGPSTQSQPPRGGGLRKLIQRARSLIRDRNTRPAERRLTLNLYDNPVVAQAISPDGQYLAYADRAGLAVLDIEGRESAIGIPIPGVSEIVALNWLIDGSKVLVTGKEQQSRRFALLEVSLSSRVIKRLALDVSRATASPDGEKIAFVDETGRCAGLIGADGEGRRILFAGEPGDKIREIMWSPDGNWIVLGRLNIGAFEVRITLDAIDLNGNRTTLLKPNPALRSSCIGQNGHIIIAVAESPPRQNDTTLLAYERVDWRRGIASAPRRLGTWRDSSLHDLSISADGTRLVFLRGSHQSAIHIGDLHSPGILREGAPRLTLVEHNDLPTAWTPDSTTILFHSDRNGKWDIWKQRVDSSRAELVVAGAGDCRGARVSPDGRWVYYFERKKGRQIWEWPASARLMRTTLFGEAPRALYRRPGPFSFRCPRTPSASCVLGQRHLRRIAFHVLDPDKGRGHKLAAVPTDAGLDHWDLSPDGDRIALVIAESGGSSRIRILSLSDGTTRDVTVESVIGFQSIDWSADGQGWYVSRSVGAGAEIIFIDPHGSATTVREQPGSFGTWAVPSPDGKKLALLEWSVASNAWIVEHF
jgi:DNA-binding winged helix-turn-helix (wHTH) protein/Tol biopolymer transport system component